MTSKRKKIGGGFIPDLEEYERENQIKPKKKRRGYLEFIFNPLRRNKK